MSQAVFPTLPGLKWGHSKTPMFETKIQTAVSGRESRARFQAYPRWKFALSYEFLRQRPGKLELDTLIGFFLARSGSFESFLYDCPSDRAAASQVFATTVAGVSKYRLVRTYAGHVAPIGAVNGSPSVYLNEILQSPSTYTIDDNGAIIFNSTPAPGGVLKWSGLFYHRVRFTKDEAEFAEFLRDLWELRKIEFVTSKEG